MAHARIGPNTLDMATPGALHGISWHFCAFSMRFVGFKSPIRLFETAFKLDELPFSRLVQVERVRGRPWPRSLKFSSS